jgi:hypothetical protein
VGDAIVVLVVVDGEVGDSELPHAAAIAVIAARHVICTGLRLFALDDRMHLPGQVAAGSSKARTGRAGKWLNDC